MLFGALWVAAGILGGVSVYFYPLFLFTMFFVPALWAAMAFKTHPVFLAVAAGTTLLFGLGAGFGLMDSLCIVGLAAPAGCLLWLLQREKMGNFQSVIGLSILLTFGIFLIFCVPDLAESGDPYASIRLYFADLPALFAGTSMERTSQYFVSHIDELMVACFYAFAGVYALVNVLLLHWLNKNKAMPLCPLAPFGTWAASFGYAMATGVGALAATCMSALSSKPLVTTLALLLYEMWALPLMMTGANVVYALMSRRLAGRRLKAGFGLLILGCVLVRFAQMALMLLGFYGIVLKRRARKERQ